MNLSLLQSLLEPPRPFRDHDNIPWSDPAFSERMLAEHLDQSHDLASRNLSIIEAQVDWIHRALLETRPSRILDLGCGPGLYANRLAELGHTVHGIDMSPASIDYARRHAAANTSFELGDLRTTRYGMDFDLAMQIYGEFNVFSPADARTILAGVAAALKSDGKLIMEVNGERALRRRSEEPRTFTVKASGLFDPGPHLLLEENHWDEETSALATRYTVLSITDGDIHQYGASYQAYIDVELAALLSDCHLGSMNLLPDLGIDAGFDGFVVEATRD